MKSHVSGMVRYFDLFFPLIYSRSLSTHLLWNSIESTPCSGHVCCMDYFWTTTKRGFMQSTSQFGSRNCRFQWWYSPFLVGMCSNAYWFNKMIILWFFLFYHCPFHEYLSYFIIFFLLFVSLIFYLKIRISKLGIILQENRALVMKNLWQKNFVTNCNGFAMNLWLKNKITFLKLQWWICDRYFCHKSIQHKSSQICDGLRWICDKKRCTFFVIFNDGFGTDIFVT